MTATSKVEQQMAGLRAPFPAEQVGLLPKITCRPCSEASGKVCAQHNKVRCQACGNYITERHMHVDYVGHGAVTDRLLEVDPQWNWEPVRFDDSGIPTFVYDGRGNPIALWIKLTVAGVTRLGVGTCPPNQADAEKVLIGDALRNAAMRFGVALDLWIKGHAEDDETAVATDERRTRDRRPDPEPEPIPIEMVTDGQKAEFAEIKAQLGEQQTAALKAWFRREKVPAFDKLTADMATVAIDKARGFLSTGGTVEPDEQPEPEAALSLPDPSILSRRG